MNIAIVDRDTIERRAREIHSGNPDILPNELREQLREEFRKRGRYFQNDEVIGCIPDPETAFMIFKGLLILGKLSLWGWRAYKGEAELPSELEEWIDAVVETLV